MIRTSAVLQLQLQLLLLLQLLLIQSTCICICTALVPQSKRFARYSHLATHLHASSSEESTIFETLAGTLGQCLILSDVKRMTGNDGASTGWTSWVDEKSSFYLQNCIDKVALVNPMNPTDPTRIDLLDQRDEAQRWIRWMKNVPAPMMIEISDELRHLVNATLDDASLQVRVTLRYDVTSLPY